MDRYLLSRSFRPMVAVLLTTMTAFLLERLLRSFYLLAQSTHGFTFLLELAVNLLPHYMGLTLPAGFFIALFIVIDRLNADSEIDAIMASGVSLSRIAAPFVGLGLVLMVFSTLLYGFIQPYARYGYRAVLHAAENAGWNGTIQPQGLLAPNPNLLLIADAVDPTGQKLERVFIRRLDPTGLELVLTAAAAEVHRDHDGRSVTLELRDGQQVTTTPHGSTDLLTFASFTTRLPLTPAAKLLRSRGGGEESELTLLELAQLGYGKDPPTLPRQTLLAELYSRIARALALPLMPLLAIPFGLTAKRAGSTSAMLVAGLILFAFQAWLVFGQGLAASGAASAALAEGWPFAQFAAACIGTFMTSRRWPGQNPVSWTTELMSDLVRLVRGGAEDPLGPRP